MFSSYKNYKARVAPIYQNELDRHLFATASFHDRALRRKVEKMRSGWRRAEWLGRWFGRDSEPEKTDD
jgi:hypothetical protein